MKINNMFRHICLGSLISISVWAMGAKTVKMKNPLVDCTNTPHLFIDTIELAPDSTTITLHTYSYLGNNITLQPSVKLVYDGKSYPLRSAKGIELGKGMDIPELGDSVFTLSFEPLPMKTKSFDFIEGDGNSDYRLECIHTDKSFDNQTPIEKLNALPSQKWEKGTAVLKGKILNYQPEDGKTSVQVYPRSVLGRPVDKNIGVAPISSDGSFAVELPLFQSYQPCFFEAPGFYGLIYLSPEKESFVSIDQSQRWSNGYCGKDGSAVFSGENEELNNQLALNIGHDMAWDSFLNNKSRDKKYASASDYKADVLRHESHCKDKIRKLPFTPMMKQLLNVNIENDMQNSLLATYSIQDCNDIDSTYYDFFREMDIEDPTLMWASDFDSFIFNAYRPHAENLQFRVNYVSPDYYSYLIDNHIVADEDADLARALMSNNLARVPKKIVDEYAKTVARRVWHYSDSLNLDGSERAKAERLMSILNSGKLEKYNDVQSHYINWIFTIKQLSIEDAFDLPFKNDLIADINSFYSDNKSVISTFKSKYKDFYNEWKFEKDIDAAVHNFSKEYGKESSLMNQLLAMHAYMNYIGQRNTLSEFKIANSRKRLPDLFFEYLMAQNNEMAKAYLTVS